MSKKREVSEELNRKELIDTISISVKIFNDNNDILDILKACDKISIIKSKS